QQQREVATLQCWRNAIVSDRLLQDLTDCAMEVQPPSSTEAARALGKLPYVGPYLVKSMLGVLTQTKRIHFDVGVVPPRSYSSVRYLLTGNPTLMRQSLWPWSNDAEGTRQRIEQLAQVERVHMALYAGGIVLVGFSPTGASLMHRPALDRSRRLGFGVNAVSRRIHTIFEIGGIRSTC
ncbi:MAG: hypothetical protein ACKPKO_17945, partial [Candidatus Fonsibacter sp.]